MPFSDFSSLSNWDGKASSSPSGSNQRDAEVDAPRNARSSMQPPSSSRPFRTLKHRKTPAFWDADLPINEPAIPQTPQADSDSDRDSDRVTAMLTAVSPDQLSVGSTFEQDAERSIEWKHGQGHRPLTAQAHNTPTNASYSRNGAPHSNHQVASSSYSSGAPEKASVPLPGHVSSLDIAQMELDWNPFSSKPLQNPSFHKPLAHPSLPSTSALIHSGTGHGAILPHFHSGYSDMSQVGYPGDVVGVGSFTSEDIETSHATQQAWLSVTPRRELPLIGPLERPMVNRRVSYELSSALGSTSEVEESTSIGTLNSIFQTVPLNISSDAEQSQLPWASTHAPRLPTTDPAAVLVDTPSSPSATGKSPIFPAKEITNGARIDLDSDVIRGRFFKGKLGSALIFRRTDDSVQRFETPVTSQPEPSFSQPSSDKEGDVLSALGPSSEALAALPSTTVQRELSTSGASTLIDLTQDDSAVATIPAKSVTPVPRDPEPLFLPSPPSSPNSNEPQPKRKSGRTHRSDTEQHVQQSESSDDEPILRKRKPFGSAVIVSRRRIASPAVPESRSNTADTASRRSQGVEDEGSIISISSDSSAPVSLAPTSPVRYPRKRRKIAPIPNRAYVLISRPPGFDKRDYTEQQRKSSAPHPSSQTTQFPSPTRPQASSSVRSPTTVLSSSPRRRRTSSQDAQTQSVSRVMDTGPLRLLSGYVTVDDDPDVVHAVEVGARQALSLEYALPYVISLRHLQRQLSLRYTPHDRSIPTSPQEDPAVEPPPQFEDNDLTGIGPPPRTPVRSAPGVPDVPSRLPTPLGQGSPRAFQPSHGPTLHDHSTSGLAPTITSLIHTPPSSQVQNGYDRSLYRFDDDSLAGAGPSSSWSIPEFQPSEFSPTTNLDLSWDGNTINPSLLLGEAPQPPPQTWSPSPSPPPGPSSHFSSPSSRRYTESVPSQFQIHTRALSRSRSPSRSTSPASQPPASPPSHFDIEEPLRDVDDGTEGSEYDPTVRPSSPKKSPQRKGKGRAADVGIRARPSATLKPVWRDRSVTPVDGKRERRPSKRVLEAGVKERNGMGAREDGVIPEVGDDTVSVASHAGKGKGKGKGKEGDRSSSRPPKRKGSQSEVARSNSGSKQTFTALAMAPTACHHCRSTTLREKMKCTVIREDGQPCTLRYCVSCIQKRYPDITFDPLAVRFQCPRCSDTCNCTVCSRRRGEEYIPERRGGYINYLETGIIPEIGSGSITRFGPPAVSLKTRPSRAASRRTRETAAASEAPRPAPRATAASLAAQAEADRLAASSLALPKGQFWGTVYGLNGGRQGTAVIATSGDTVIIKNTVPDPVVVKHMRKRRGYVGIPQPHFSAAARAGSLISELSGITPSPAPTEATAAAASRKKGAFVGSRHVLSDSRYKSLDEHIKEQSDVGSGSSRSPSPLSELTESEDEGDGGNTDGAGGVVGDTDAVVDAFKLAEIMHDAALAV
ncbi:hypothetical protein BXZ70DRAFT_953158 [Cristinia sonorae]|uniref:Zinc-finger domain-containing protein n=1 Tax=Cristinia sonorae TaxID=1940300 RepID=A0A8K0UGW1_9AGAR|nr:hypothetical protein BXZ70DRAFT_953158 [Cristinia sonorae]